ncbi:MAG: hypothetical protein IPG45_17885 [Deltaproteobacteria bacterium]|nr:hypothetical protein [Deltaproteobacteria bacterium]
MTRIDRESFVRSLEQRPIDLRSSDSLATAVRESGIPATELEAIAGADHVIQGRAEAEQLYDRISALEARSPTREGQLNRAERIRAAADSRPEVDVITGADPRAESVRPPVTGIWAPPRLLPTLTETMAMQTEADHVRSVGDVAARSLNQAAERNVTGPEAQAQRSIRTLTRGAVADVSALEASRDQHPVGSPARADLDRQIGERVERFENAVRAEQLYATGGTTVAQNPPGEGLTSRLPPYVREAVQREGAFIPGLPGAVAPRFGDTPGFDLRFKF